MHPSLKSHYEAPEIPQEVVGIVLVLKILTQLLRNKSLYT